MPLDAPYQVPIEDKVLSDHVFDILEHYNQSKEYNRGWLVAPINTPAKVEGLKNELRASNSQL